MSFILNSTKCLKKCLPYIFIGGFFCLLMLKTGSVSASPASATGADMNKKTISVTGMCHSKIAPDVGGVNFYITVTEQTSEDASKEIYQIFEKLQKTLEQKIKGVKIYTQNFYINKEYEYVNQGDIRNKKIFKGYNAKLYFEAETHDIKKIGQIVSVASSFNNLELQGIASKLSPSLYKKSQDECKAIAVGDAKQTAKKMLEPLGKKLGEVIHINDDISARIGVNPIMPKPQFMRADMVSLSQQESQIGFKRKEQDIFVKIQAIFQIK